MKYKAIFFDRDNTLTKRNPAKIEWEKRTIEGWTKKPFVMNHEKAAALHELAGRPDGGFYDLAEERRFYIHYYQVLLSEEGVTESVKEKAGLLFTRLWCKSIIPYPETVEVLEYFRQNGYRMGVISDTAPSLRATLDEIGLAEYFDCFICSDLIGAMKPDPKIYQAALKELKVEAPQSIYVDGYDIEANGARALGFTAFNMVRDGEPRNKWEISNLRQLIDFVKNSG
ncbi:MAG: HAD family hydrolase [Candidatus Gastranaerophilaceae bacterium]|jgi:putative hydrolase of the HAD superfamily|nr:HAD family hydrolase [Christensenellales bacterium]